VSRSWKKSPCRLDPAHLDIVEGNLPVEESKRGLQPKENCFSWGGKYDGPPRPPSEKEAMKKCKALQAGSLDRLIKSRCKRKILFLRFARGSGRG